MQLIAVFSAPCFNCWDFLKLWVNILYHLEISGLLFLQYCLCSILSFTSWLISLTVYSAVPILSFLFTSVRTLYFDFKSINSIFCFNLKLTQYYVKILYIVVCTSTLFDYILLTLVYPFVYIVIILKSLSTNTGIWFISWSATIDCFTSWFFLSLFVFV